ncbi:MAG: hypothetical protein IJ368_02010 [Oscillospiraceae bacterium]|nr:hypothetical protein [Oscillospiraceae bacterium]
MIHIFIINSFAGQKMFAEELREQLSTLTGLEYFVFNTRYEGYETILVQKILKIFEGRKLRFYCCGGSGTMRKMLDGFDDISTAEVAFYPCGLTNDFLKMFGDAKERFYDIKELIYGDVIEIDYIKSNLGIALNTLSTGLDSNCVDKMNDYRILRFINTNLPYTFATFYSIFISKVLEYEVTLDNVSYIDKFAEIFIGNGCIFGGNMHFAEKTCINDGKAIYRLAGNKRGFDIIPTLLALIGKKYHELPELMQMGECSNWRIKRTDNSPFTINLDGDLIKNITLCEASIVRKGLHFVVPKGVKI